MRHPRHTPPEALQAIQEIEGLGFGLAAWWCDVLGHVVARPDPQGVRGQILSSDAMAKHVERVCRSWVDTGECSTCEVFAGCWLFPYNPPHGIRREGFVAAMGFGPEAFEAPEMQRMLSALGITPARARAALGSEPTQTPQGMETIRRVLDGSSRARFAEAETHESVIEQVSRELADMYEHVSALFALARVSTRVTAPLDVVRISCEQLCRTLRFRWVAACFKPDLACEDLQSVVIMAGTPGADQQSVESMLLELTAQHTGDSWTNAFKPGEHPLATLTGEEVAVDPIVAEETVLGLLVAGGKYGHDPDVSSVDMQLIDAAADLLGSYHQNISRHEAHRAMFLGTVRALSASIDAKDPYTRGHSDRVAIVGREIARAIGMSDAEAERVHFAGVLHDVGKIGVPESVLRKPGKLTEEEFGHIKRHPRVGHEILQDIPGLEDILPAVLHHHERWDGRGYPDGLEGEQSPLIARIIGLADAFDAMSSNRSYRAARDRNEVLAEIARCAGSQFDPALAEAFSRVDLSKFDRSLVVERRRAA